ncbi:MAG: MBOAT family O-acyltransferase [Lachnospiraceae bacterium]
MLFNSYSFILCFLPIVLIGYYGIQQKEKYKWMIAWLIVMSFCFYGYQNISYVLLLGTSIIINYVLSRVMNKISLIFGIFWNVGLLFYFKYFDFFIENINFIFETKYSILNIMLPLGISFFTFQQLSYLIDCYKEEVPKYTLMEYTCYVSFFPQLVAGPIVTHKEFIPQLRERRGKKISYENMEKGLYIFAIGLGKKVLIADNLSKIVAIGFQGISEMTSLSLMIVLVSYTFQLYYDFSGYCDMAVGIGYLFNFKLPYNFNSPYKASSIGEYWNRWHMTLTRFFTQYLYIPLGGNRKGKIRTYANTLFVFTVSGIWHGANWTFILWGIAHGIALTIQKMWNDCFPKRKEKKGKITTFFGVAITFVFVNLANILFRSQSVGQAKEFLLGMIFNKGDGISYKILEEVNNWVEVRLLIRLGLQTVVDAYPVLPLIAIMGMIALITFIGKNTQEKSKKEYLGKREMILTVFLFVWSVISLSDVSEFLYFNF